MVLNRTHIGSVDDVLKVGSGEIFTSGFVKGLSNLGAITPPRGALWVLLDMPLMPITITTFQQITPRHAFHPRAFVTFKSKEVVEMVRYVVLRRTGAGKGIRNFLPKAHVRGNI